MSKWTRESCRSLSSGSTVGNSDAEPGEVDMETGLRTRLEPGGGEGRTSDFYQGQAELQSDLMTPSRNSGRGSRASGRARTTCGRRDKEGKHDVARSSTASARSSTSRRESTRRSEAPYQRKTDVLPPVEEDAAEGGSPEVKDAPPGDEEGGYFDWVRVPEFMKTENLPEYAKVFPSEEGREQALLEERKQKHGRYCEVVWILMIPVMTFVVVAATLVGFYFAFTRTGQPPAGGGGLPGVAGGGGGLVVAVHADDAPYNKHQLHDLLEPAERQQTAFAANDASARTKMEILSPDQLQVIWQRISQSRRVLVGAPIQTIKVQLLNAIFAAFVVAFNAHPVR
ncbi:unnamed protein product [Amoebophrya sp. A25]|nr:unnamed protein product [Amoebophrya sp. A25]|eukprot:GSA25T00016651001.1